MTRIAWWLVDKLSHLLAPDERDAVRGDLAEVRETSWQTLRSILGLVVRRQAALWKDWRPWMALTGLVVPLGMLVTSLSRRMADTSAIYLWLYFNNWTPAYLANVGARHDLVYHCADILLGYLALALIPALRGIHDGLQLTELPRLPRILVCASATATILALVTQNWRWWQMRTGDIPLLAIIGPAVYLITTRYQRWCSKNAIG